MQTLWSRAAQSRCTCRCSSCLSSATALARRTTTATGRRRLKFGDAFTLFYSSIFATAAVADAKVKDDRRKEWDRAIVEAKKKLKELDQRDSNRGQLKEGLDEQALRAPKKGRLEWHEILKLRPEDLDDRWSSSQMGLKILPPDIRKQLSQSQIDQILTSNQLLKTLMAGWSVHTTQRRAVREAHYPPQSVEVDASSRPPRQLSLKKLRTLELSVAKLVLRFLSVGPIREHTTEHQKGQDQLGTLGEREPTDRADLQLKIHNLEGHLRRVRRDQEPTGRDALGWPVRPAFSTNHPSSSEQERLNNALRIILRAQDRAKNLGSMVEDICRELLLSTAPPNVDTYNLLIVYLTRLRQNKMVNLVLDSFNESHIRPNEATVSAVLKFYTVSRNKKMFEEYVSKMHGHGGGLALARPDIEITDAGQERLVQKGGKTVQKAPMNQHVFGALIHGTLKFFGIKTAMKVYLQMTEAGWEPNAVILTSILRDCHLRRAWEDGQAVWQRIRDVSGKISDRAYLWMLQLCRVCKRQQVYEEIKQELIRVRRSVDFLEQLPTDMEGSWIDDIETIKVSWRKAGAQSRMIAGANTPTGAERVMADTSLVTTATPSKHHPAKMEIAIRPEMEATASAANNIEVYETHLQTREPKIVAQWTCEYLEMAPTSTCHRSHAQ